MPWNIETGPHTVEPQGFDATLWRWQLVESETGLTAEVIVKVSGTAMASAVETLPDATKLARETAGRSEVEAVVNWWQPPRLIEMDSLSTEGHRVGGSVDNPQTDDHPEAQRRIEQISGWMAARGVGLWFDQPGNRDLWLALMIPEGHRVGAAEAGSGATRLAAAEDALRLFLERQTGERSAQVVEIGPAHETDTALPIQVVSPVGIPSEEAFGTPAVEIPAEVEEARARLEEIAADFAWKIAFASEPDGSWFWLVIDAETEELIKGGQADTWEDALLAAIEELQPPSAER